VGKDDYLETNDIAGEATSSEPADIAVNGKSYPVNSLGVSSDVIEVKANGVHSEGLNGVHREGQNGATKSDLSRDESRVESGEQLSGTTQKKIDSIRAKDKKASSKKERPRPRGRSTDRKERRASTSPPPSFAETPTALPAEVVDRKAAGERILASMKSERSEMYGMEAMEMEVGWAKRGKSNAWVRTFEIWMFFVRVLFAELALRREKDKDNISSIREENAKRLRFGLLRLGPTFIKLGQLLSTRVDVLPIEYVNELKVLQDKVPGFDGKRAVEIVETDLGSSIENLFDAFDETPIAAASLGQVHLAVLKGEQVAVKIQRQGLKDLFDVDLKNLKVLAKLLDKFDPKTDGANRDWVSIYEESAKLLYEEIDYFAEGRNADRFRKNFAKVKWVKVPRVYWDRTTTRVLSMEYCPGIKISEKEELARNGVNLNLLAERSGQSYLTQLFRHGFFHCDPHPGNMSVDNVDGGRLIYYDFGMMAEIKPKVKEGLVNLIFGVYEGNEKDICNALEQMGILNPNVDRITVEKVGRYFLKSFRENMQRGAESKSEAQTKAELSERLSAIGEDLVSVGDDQPFKFPATFTFVFRAFTTLEGIGKGLSPDYDLTKIAQPFLKELIDLKDGSAAESAAKNVRKALGWRKRDLAAVVQQPRKVDYIADIVHKMEQGEFRVRARVLESERAFKRAEVVQENLGFGILASTFLNSALVLSASAGRIILATRMLWILALLSGIRLLLGVVKLRNLDSKFKKYSGRS